MSRILGIDYGRKRLGLAISDELEMISSPLSVIPNNGSYVSELKKICRENSVAKIVIGLPYSEKYTEAAREVLSFAETLKKNFDIEIDFQNEECSTVFSKSLLKSMGINKKRIKTAIDKYAAQKILEDYISSNHVSQ
jgi:putative Holliday junction resolvase